MTDDQLIKVFFDLGLKTESVWAEPLFQPDSRPSFIIRNSPFYVKGISFLDIVYAVPRSLGGYEFREVVGRGGHSTYWIFSPQADNFDRFWPRLAELGCSYESSTIDPGPLLYVLDVPDTCDIGEVEAILEEGTKSGLWRWEEANVEHKR